MYLYIRYIRRCSVYTFDSYAITRKERSPSLDIYQNPKRGYARKPSKWHRSIAVPSNAFPMHATINRKVSDVVLVDLSYFSKLMSEYRLSTFDFIGPYMTRQYEILVIYLNKISITFLVIYNSSQSTYILELTKNIFK